DEFEQMRASLTASVGKAVRDIVASNHAQLLAFIDALISRATAQASDVDKLVQNAGRPQAANTTHSAFLSELGFKDDECKVEPRGQLPTKRFVAKLCGLPGPASKKVQRALAGLRSDDKSWKEFRVAAPGSPIDARPHLGPDKSPKQIK
ncbi:unnamed protein product, partial [Prorocentrum cordatum]